MLRETVKNEIRMILSPTSPYPIPQGIEIEVMGDESTANSELISPIAMVLSRTIHQPAREIANYLVNELEGKGYRARVTNAGFVEISQ